jgi:hypothetical protein
MQGGAAAANQESENTSHQHNTTQEAETMTEVKKADEGFEEGALSADEAQQAQGGIIIDITGAGLKTTSKIGATTTTKFGGDEWD